MSSLHVNDKIMLTAIGALLAAAIAYGAANAGAMLPLGIGVVLALAALVAASVSVSLAKRSPRVRVLMD